MEDDFNPLRQKAATLLLTRFRKEAINAVEAMIQEVVLDAMMQEKAGKNKKPDPCSIKPKCLLFSEGVTIIEFTPQQGNKALVAEANTRTLELFKALNVEVSLESGLAPYVKSGAGIVYHSNDFAKVLEKTAMVHNESTVNNYSLAPGLLAKLLVQPNNDFRTRFGSEKKISHSRA